MQKKELQLNYLEFDSATELDAYDQQLLAHATAALKQSYATYSRFCVGAAARLANGIILTGANQENAAYSVTICAERVLLANIAMQHPNVPIEAMAITYKNMQDGAKNNAPISPCGMCRQALAEFEDRLKAPMKLILAGGSGTVLLVEDAESLLPLAFGAGDLL